MTQFRYRGATLLLAVGEFEARVGGQAQPLGSYMHELNERLSQYYCRHSAADGHRDLIITLAPGGRCRSWLTGRNLQVATDEQQGVADIMAHVPLPLGVLRPILFALTYSLGEASVAALGAFRFPPELLRFRPPHQEVIDTEHLLDFSWADSESDAV